MLEREFGIRCDCAQQKVCRLDLRGLGEPILEEKLQVRKMPDAQTTSRASLKPDSTRDPTNQVSFCLRMLARGDAGSWPQWRNLEAGFRGCPVIRCVLGALLAADPGKRLLQIRLGAGCVLKRTVENRFHRVTPKFRGAGL